MPQKEQEWTDGITFKENPTDNVASTVTPVAAVQQPPPPQKTSTSMLATMPCTQKAADKDVQLLMALNDPRVILFGELLTHEECDQLIEFSKPKLKPSTVVNPVNGDYDFDSTRSSQGCFFQRGENELIQRIEQRISALISVPVSRGEPISVLNYKPGEEYQPHWDYFDPKHSGNEQSLSRGGQRYATLIMYLNDVEAGGSTIFPNLGLDVMPRKGHAVFFAYADAEGNLDENSLHGGSPVGTGEKWIATKWLRLYDF